MSDRERDEAIVALLGKIASSLGWACLWLFCITLNTCDADAQRRFSAGYTSEKTADVRPAP